MANFIIELSVKEKEEGSSLSCTLSICVLSKYSIFDFDIYNTIDI